MNSKCYLKDMIHAAGKIQSLKFEHFDIYKDYDLFRLQANGFVILLTLISVTTYVIYEITCLHKGLPYNRDRKIYVILEMFYTYFNTSKY